MTMIAENREFCVDLLVFPMNSEPVSEVTTVFATDPEEAAPKAMAEIAASYPKDVRIEATFIQPVPSEEELSFNQGIA
jgi:hypothetical protein